MLNRFGAAVPESAHAAAPADEADEPVEDRPDEDATVPTGADDTDGADDEEIPTTSQSPAATTDLVEDTAPEDTAPPARQPATAAPPPEGETPCEIAADELPQAGQ
ncbi:MAG: hypothetical protein F6Q13_19095 [Mycobacterium sp.]|nr:MAG: hypothetical protein F6Q13_19095 [Mycobacterium sp.]